MSYYEIFKHFEALSIYQQIAYMEGILKSGGIETKRSKSKGGREITFYTGEDVVLAIGPSKGEIARLYTVMDRDFYDKWFANGEGSLSFNKHRVKNENYDYKVIGYNIGGINQDKLHRLVLKTASVNIEGLMVDHKYMNPLINTREALRVATNSQNRGNCRLLRGRHDKKLKKSLMKKDFERFVDEERKRYGEFAYNPLTDFTKTWYAYVLYRMFRGICSWDELKKYNGDYIDRNDADAARYYEKILKP